MSNKQSIDCKDNLKEGTLMLTEISHALNFMEKYNVTLLPDFIKLRSICIQEGLTIKFFPFSGRIKAIYHNTEDQIELLTIKKGLPEPQIKHILASVLAHRLLSRPSSPCSYAEMLGTSEYYFDVKTENFAALFLVPPPALDGIYGQISAFEISRLARIPESLAEKRVVIYRQHCL